MLATIFDSRFTVAPLALAPLTNIGVGSLQNNVGRTQKQQV
jgi:hypothetical protein